MTGARPDDPGIAEARVSIEDHVVVRGGLVLTDTCLDDRSVLESGEAPPQTIARHREEPRRDTSLEAGGIHAAALQVGMDLEALSFQRRDPVALRTQLHPDRRAGAEE